MPWHAKSAHATRIQKTPYLMAKILKCFWIPREAGRAYVSLAEQPRETERMRDGITRRLRGRRHARILPAEGSCIGRPAGGPDDRRDSLRPRARPPRRGGERY